jgi:iron(III) transport system ATP-binding protein
MLRLCDLSLRYGKHAAVRDLSLELGDGEIVTLVGPTGCGKSSVLRLVAGLVEPGGGYLELEGRRIDRQHPLPPEQRRMGMVFQDFALFPHLTVRQNVAFRVRDPALAAHWIEALGLEAHADAWPATLSGGQKQRVALARALAHEPAIVLLDEPLSNLDAAMKGTLRWQIRDALKAAGVAALWVTHDQDEALSVCDRMGVMRDGALEQIGDPEHCYRTPATRFVAGFLGDGVFLRGRVVDGAVVTGIGTLPLPAEGVARPAGSSVDVLLRPHDVHLEADEAGSARICWGRYEGETRLYRLHLDDGTDFTARVDHELRLASGQRVRTWISARHGLPLFDPADGELAGTAIASAAVGCDCRSSGD